MGSPWLEGTEQDTIGGSSAEIFQLSANLPRRARSTFYANICGCAMGSTSTWTASPRCFTETRNATLMVSALWILDPGGFLSEVSV